MNVLIAYAMLIFGLGINYIFNVVVARSLGADNFGDFSYGIYLFNIFSLIAVLSLDQGALRFIPQTTRVAEVRSSIQRLAMLSGIIFTSIFLLVIHYFLEGHRQQLAYLFAASLIPFVILTVNVAVLQAEHIVGPRMAFRYLIEPVVKFLVFLLLFNSFHSSNSPVIALFVALLTANIAALIAYREKLFRFVNIAKAEYKKVLNFAMPMSVGNALNVLSGRLDVLILGALVGALDLGHYSAAFQTASIIAIVLQGIETVYAPIFSGHIGKKNYADLKNDYQKALRWAMLVSCPMIMTILVFPEVFMIPFGDEYKAAASILAVLCFGQFINIALGSCNTLLIMLGKTKLALLIGILYALLTALLVALGAHYANVLGAAFGVVGAIFITNITRVICVHRLTGCHPFSVYYVKICLSLIVSILIGVGGKHYFQNYAFPLPALMFIALGILFFMHPEDKQVIRKIFSMIIERVIAFKK